ncbi:MAG: hypothetical protein V7603_5123 [Micromonosporaceae bacterium]
MPDRDFASGGGDNPGHGVPRRRTGPGRASNVQIFIRTRREPGWLASLRGGKRASVEQQVRKLEELPRPLLALVVWLEGRILSRFGTRRAFIDHIAGVEPRLAGRVTQKVLNKHLGGDRVSGPEWWLAELIARHCAHPDEHPGDVVAGAARFWTAALGHPPPNLPVDPAGDDEIAALVNAAPDPAAEAAEQLRDAQVQVQEVQAQAAAALRAAADAEHARAALAQRLVAETTERASAEALASASHAVADELRERLTSTERDRARDRDVAAEAETQVDSLREQLARLAAELELGTTEAAGATTSPSANLIAAASAEVTAARLLPSVVVRARREIAATAPPAHRALAIYLAVHAELRGSNVHHIAGTANINVEMVERALTARPLPGTAITAAIGDVLDTDPVNLRRLQELAEQQRDRDLNPFSAEFHRITSAISNAPTTVTAVAIAPGARQCEGTPVDWPPGSSGRSSTRGWNTIWRRLAVTLAVAIVVLGGGGILYSFDESEFLVHDSGDKPEVYQRLDGCSTYACAYLDNFEWTIPVGGQISSTFRRKETRRSVTPERLRGTLKTQSSQGWIQPGCEGARIDWTIRVDDGAPTEGTLSGTSVSTLDMPIPADLQKVTVTARRNDDRSCAATFRWDEPKLVDLRP